MSAPLHKSFEVLGVTPWQLILGVACIGSWWATVQPLPGKLEQLNNTVQALSTKVEIQAVLLNSVKELHQDVKDNRNKTQQEIKSLREELGRIYGKLAVNKTNQKGDVFSRVDSPNELSPIK